MQPNMLFSYIKKEFINYKYLITEIENKCTKKIKGNKNILESNNYILDDIERIKEVDMILDNTDNSILSNKNMNNVKKMKFYLKITKIKLMVY